MRGTWPPISTHCADVRISPHDFDEVMLGDAADAVAARYVPRRHDQDVVASLEGAIEIDIPASLARFLDEYQRRQRPADHLMARRKLHNGSVTNMKCRRLLRLQSHGRSRGRASEQYDSRCRQRVA